MLAALPLHNDNAAEVAENLQLPVSTVKNWRSGLGINDEIRRLGEIKKADLRLLFAALAHKGLLTALDKLDSNADNIKFAELTTGAAIALDKIQLLDGQPTNITENGSPADYSTKLDELRSKREKRESAG